MRVGTGWDVHKLVKGRKLILGGVEIKFPKGLLGHSDADVLAHAITDSLFGAAGLGDIGTHFPPSDSKFKNISSILLLEQAVKLVRKKGFRVLNVDSTVITEEPKLGKFIPLIRQKLAKSLGITVDKISVKAKTEEKLGYIGKGKAIAAQAVCLIN